jgi:hypothetical protein
MARIYLPAQVVDQDGLVNAPFVTATDIGATFTIDADAEIEIVNGGGVSTTVTIETAGTTAGLAVADISTAIPAGQRGRFGHFDQRAFPRPPGGSDAGKIYVNLSAVATVTAQSFK